MSAQEEHREDIVLSSIEEIIEDVKAGKPVILVDDEDRENEGDFIVAAEMVTPENINIMARDGRGLICLPMESTMVDRLGLELMGRGDNSRHKTAFTVSIEAKEGVTTGISAADRAHTVKVAIDPNSTKDDIATPGHVFPLLARDGGVLVRAGHTEAAVDLAKLAGFSGAGVICEIMNDDGTMARLPDLITFAEKHDYKIGTIADLIAYRRKTESLIKQIHEETLTSRYGGEFQFKLYANTLHYAEHIALVKGDVANAKEPVFVRMHALNMVEDILGGTDDSILHQAMSMIGEAGTGAIVIIRDSDPTNLSKRIMKTEAPKKEDQLRQYGIGAQILKDLGIERMTLLTNSPKTVVGLEGYDLFIEGHKEIKA